MEIYQAYKFRLKTNPEIEKKLTQFAGCCRFVWNKALFLIKERLDHKIPILWYRDLAGLLRLWKKSEEYHFLKNAHSQILQQTLKDLEKAIKLAFQPDNDFGFPKFKKKNKNDSFKYPQGFKISNNRIYLPKIGWVGFYKSKEIEGKVKQIVIKKEYDKWFVSVFVEKQIYTKERKDNPVGLDIGVKKIVTLSNGISFKPLNILKLERKLTREQRKLSRREKFSKNWFKQVKKINKIWEKITNTRNDYIHKITTAIAKNHGIVVVEDLKIKNMTKSAKGTLDNPGKNVRQKAGLNRSILRQAWGKFFNILEYKLRYSGGKLIKVNPRDTSITCPECGIVSKENRKTQAKFKCVKCGYTNNADIVGAINILRRYKVEPTTIKNLPQGMWEVKPEEHGRVHALRQESAGNREGLPLYEVA